MRAVGLRRWPWLLASRTFSIQEQRDHVPPGTYQRLIDTGVLLVAEGLRVQPPLQLWEALLDRWGTPVKLLCDRFRVNELADAVKGEVRIEPRITRWSDSSADIRGLRKLVKDGSSVSGARLAVGAGRKSAECSCEE